LVTQGAIRIIAPCGSQRDAGSGAPLFVPALRVTSMPYRWTQVAEQGRQQWMLPRNCALTPRQLAGWFATMGAVSLLIAAAFAMQGAWMVVPFACVELAALGIAFVVYARHAADYERIMVAPGRLVVERVVGNAVDRIECEPAWVRVEYAGTRRSAVRLVAGRRQFEIGRFVPEDKRKELAQELRESLARTRAW
jgi:uncharacterized membrane protein